VDIVYTSHLEGMLVDECVYINGEKYDVDEVKKILKPLEQKRSGLVYHIETKDGVVVSFDSLKITDIESGKISCSLYWNKRYIVEINLVNISTLISIYKKGDKEMISNIITSIYV